MKNIVVSKIKAGKEWLKTLLKINAEINLIITLKNNKASDRCSFLDISKKYNIPLITVNNINEEEVKLKIKKINPELIWVLGWSQLLKSDIINIPKIGCIGSHPTELPKYRGRAPIPWSIIKGLEESALTFFWIDKQVDRGDILIQKKFKININDTAKDVYNKMIFTGKDMIKDIYPKLIKGNIPRKPQNPNHFIEEWPERTYKDSEIDWSKSKLEIHNQIRAVAGIYPWAYTYISGKKLLFKKTKFKNGKIIFERVEIE